MKANEHGFQWLRNGWLWLALLFILPTARGQEFAQWDALQLGVDAVADELVVIYKEGAVQPVPQARRLGVNDQAWQAPISASVTHERTQARSVRPFKRVTGELVALPAGSGLRGLKAAAAVYAANPDVLAVEPNFIRRTLATPNDKYYMDGSLWGLKDIGAPEAWDLTTGSSNIVVAVIDTGIGAGNRQNVHPDLEDNYPGFEVSNMWHNPGETGTYVGEDGETYDRATDGIDNDGNGYVDDWSGWNCVANTNSPVDGDGHGTHCAGTIGALGNNNIGVVGVNWKVSLVPVKGLDDNGYGTTADLVRAIEYVAWFDGKDGRPRIHLSNNSWGGTYAATAERMAIEKSRDAGQLFIAAAGNSSMDNDVIPHYPSSFNVDNIIAVASLDRKWTNETHTAYVPIKSSFSNYGLKSVHLGAPGSGIWSTVPTNLVAVGYKSMDGTSMAAPHVAGAAALLLALVPEADYTMVREAILESARMNPVADLQGKVSTGGKLYLPTAMMLLNSLQVSPHGETLKVVGPLGGTFKGLPTEYALRNNKSDNAIDFLAEIHYVQEEGRPDPGQWLDLYWNDAFYGQTVSASLAPQESGTLTVSTNDVTAALPYGTYTAKVTVTDLTPDSNVAYTNTIVLKVSENYVLQSAPYEWIAPTQNAVTVTQFETQKFDIPFAFTYYDTVCTQLWVSANGMIGFSPSAFPIQDNEALPVRGLDVPLIMPYWDSLLLGSAATVKVETVQRAGVPEVVVTWEGVYPREASADAASMDFQVVLSSVSSTPGMTGPRPDELSPYATYGNDIRFNYKRVAQDQDAGAAHKATVGLQDNGFLSRVYTVNGDAPEVLVYPDGAPVETYGRQAMWLADGQSLRFTWHKPAEDKARPLVVSFVNTLILPGDVELNFQGTARFELRFNEVVLDLTAADFEFSADTIPGAVVTQVTGGGERFFVTVRGFMGYGRIRIRVASNAVFDLSKNWNSLASEWSLAVVPYVETHLKDDFEHGPGGWTVSTNSYVATTTAGWELGNPAGYGPRTAHTPNNCWGTILKGPCSSGMNAWLMSPKMYLDDQPVVYFYYWMSLNYDDMGYFEINAGNGWEVLAIFSPGDSYGWRLADFEVPEKYAHKAVNFRFRLRTSLLYAGAPGLYIDDFRVVSVQPPGLWLLDAGPQALPVSASTQVETRVYNSSVDVMPTASGTYGSADSGLTIQNGTKIFYGSLEPGEIYTNRFITAITAAASSFYTNRVVLTHAGYNGPELITDNEIMLSITNAPAVSLTKNFTAFTTKSVVDWLGRPLQGNGSQHAMIYQLIYAGASGTPNAPGSQGTVTGDDRVLYTAITSLPYGRIGENGVEPDKGLFKGVFMHNLNAGNKVFVRAWDAETFEAAVAYGDSVLYTMTAAANQQYDFGTWVVGTPTQFTRDMNGDGVPDGWSIHLNQDPRETDAPLAPAVVTKSQTQGQSSNQSAANFIYQPRRAVSDGTYVFCVNRKQGVANGIKGEVQAWSKDLTTRLVTVNAVTINAKTYTFDPTSLCLDRTNTKLYVTTAGDTMAGNLNGRILTFGITTANGKVTALTYQSAFPAFTETTVRKDQTGCFGDPMDIVLESDESVYVVDQYATTSGIRIQNITLGATTPAATVWARIPLASTTSTNQFAANNKPISLALDANTLYVGSQLNGASFTACIDKANRNDYPVYTETIGGGLRSAQGIAIGISNYVYVAESDNNAIAIYAPGSRRTRVANNPVPVAAYFPASGTLGGSAAGQFKKPQGIFIDKTTPYHSVLVADTDNNRLQWVRLYVDVDGDGIDDIWESYYFGSPELCEAWDDPDGDGLPNIGEYRAGTNPLDYDTNDNGGSDSWDMNNGIDPIDGTTPTGTIPTVISVSASTNAIMVGQSVTLTVTFSSAVKGSEGDNPLIRLVFADASQTGDIMLTKLSDTVYQFIFTARESSPAGWVANRISGASSPTSPFLTMAPMPAEFPDLFEIIAAEDPFPTPTEPIIITEFTIDPLFIKWTAQPDVHYWVMSSTTLTGVWEKAYGDAEGFSSNDPGTSELDHTDENPAIYEEPVRFYKIHGGMPPDTP